MIVRVHRVAIIKAWNPRESTHRRGTVYEIRRRIDARHLHANRYRNAEPKNVFHGLPRGFSIRPRCYVLSRTLATDAAARTPSLCHTAHVVRLC